RLRAVTVAKFNGWHHDDSGDHSGDVHKRSDKRRHTALEATRRADAEQPPHDQAEIESAGVDKHALEDIRRAAQMRPAHATSVIGVGEAAFDPLAAAPQ